MLAFKSRVYSNKNLVLPILGCEKWNLLQKLPISSGDKHDGKLPKPLQMAYVSYESTHSYGKGSEPMVPIIIMHGLFGSKANWNSLCKAIHKQTRTHRKVIAVDARNHGDSPHAREHSYEAMALDIKALMESQHIEKTALMGHSMGGRACMWFALNWPHLVERLIVADISPISTSHNFGATARFFDAMQSVHLAKDISLSTARQRADASLARIISDKGVRAFLLTNLVQKSDGNFTWRINIPALVVNYQKIATFPKLDPGLKYEGPTMFIAGGASDFIQKRDHTSIQKLFPSAEFRTIEGAGHWVHSEKPYEFLHMVLEMLNRPSKPTITFTPRPLVTNSSLH